MSYQSEVLADSPGAYYRLGESSGQPQDISGNGNHTTVTNGTPTYSQPSLITNYPENTAILFDGATEYFTAPDQPTVDPGDVFTLEAWIKRGVTGAGEWAILTKGNDAVASGGGLYIENDNLMLGSVGVVIIVRSNVSIADTLKHHVAATKDGATVKLYIDGIDRTGTVTNVTCGTNAKALMIGAEDNNGSIGSFWDGVLDEVAIYSTALTGARIKTHFDAASAVETLTSLPRRGVAMVG